VSEQSNDTIGRRYEGRVHVGREANGCEAERNEKEHELTPAKTLAAIKAYILVDIAHSIVPMPKNVHAMSMATFLPSVSMITP
jgi:hypothetical protein